MGRTTGVVFAVAAIAMASGAMAQQRGVTGWVANRADGAVEAVFEGEPDAVERLVELCRAGPRGARVDSVDVVDEEPEGLSGFAVR